MILFLAAWSLLGFQNQNPVTGPLHPSFHLAAGAPGYGKPHTYLLIREGYACLIDDRVKDPLWVQERLTAGDLQPESTQGTRLPSTYFKPDPDLPAGARSELTDYSHSGYDRGHMAPSGDMRKLDTPPIDPKVRQVESFYLSNIVPQNGPLNQHLWAQLEDQVRTYTKQFGEMQIITGPVFRSSHGVIPTIGNHVGVPAAVFKIAVVTQGPQRGACLAVMIPNQVPTHPLASYATKISVIENATGLHFFTALSTTDRQRLESGQTPQLPLPTALPN